MKNNKIKNKSYLVVLVLIFISLITLIPLSVSAVDQLVPCGDGKSYNNRCTLCDLLVGINNVLDYGYRIAFIITLACITFAGIMYLVSSGDESLMTSAKAFIKASLIGFALIFCAWVIVATMLTWMSYNQANQIRAEAWNRFTCGN